MAAFDDAKGRPVVIKTIREPIFMSRLSRSERRVL
jgi:hypothetical protein